MAKPENFCELLSEARKYWLGLVLATQYAAQLESKRAGQDSLLSAVFGNVGTWLTFRLRPEDAKLVAPMLHPVFSSLDLMGLSNWQGYVHTQLNNEVTPPFSFHSLKTRVPFDGRHAWQIKEISRRVHGLEVDEVDRQIRYRRARWSDEE